jgi:hypothetical protein
MQNQALWSPPMILHAPEYAALPSTPATCFARSEKRRSILASPSLFEEFEAFDRARLAIRDGALLRFGAETGPVPMGNYGAWRFTRIAGPTPDSPDVYSPLDEGWVSPGYFESSGRPIWKPLPVAAGATYAKAATYGEQIRAELAANDPAVLTLERDFETQSVDPMFLEPECGLAWYDPAARQLELVLGVQSPFEAAGAIADLLGEAADGLKPSGIKTQFAYVGGGFGGRDHTPFPLYVALAALFLPGRPVRLAHDRWQQFQGGIKRHAFKMASRIGVDRRTGRILAFAADHVLDGGGLALGAGDQLRHQRIQRGSRRHPGDDGGGTRGVPLWLVAGRTRALGHLSDRSPRQPVA